MLIPAPQMKEAPPARQSKNGASLETQTLGASGNSTPLADLGATPEEALRRVLFAKLEQLGLPTSSMDGDSFLICGQAFDLRTATAYARQLGRIGA